MSRIILVTGGSRSGKSRFAEDMLKDKTDVLYIATAVVTDGEMAERIEKHRERRSGSWKTYEGFKDLDKALEGDNCSHIMLDCVTVMMTNLIFESYRDFDNLSSTELEKLHKDIELEFVKLIGKVREQGKHLVMVTNEVGYGLVPEYKLGRIFRDMAGSINQRLGALSDEAYLVACGLPLKLK
jgi:adenosylcobinamide kinase / adenosylcobinamide-phosphate guanylyltransferase